MELLTEGERNKQTKKKKSVAWQKSQPWTKTSGKCEEKSIAAVEGKVLMPRLVSNITS